MSKTKLFLLLSLFYSSTLLAQAPAWILAKSIGGSGPDEAWAIDEDDQGNIYVTGYFFGISYFDGDTLISNGGSDVFLASYTPLGDLRWARHFGGTGNDYGFDLEVEQGQLYISGAFAGTAIFETDTLSSAGNLDMFVARFDLSGNLDWTFHGGGSAQDNAYGVRPDGMGHIYFGGMINGQAVFGNDTVTSRGSEDLFLAKLDTLGNYIWGRHGGSTMLDRGWALTTDAAGNPCIAGTFLDVAIFETDTVVATGAFDAVMASYDPNGNLRWLRSGGGASDDYALGVEGDPSGNIYLTGYFGQTANFGSISLSTAGSNDFFVLKYDSNGNSQWGRSGGGSLNDFSNGVAVDTAGNVFLTGRIEGAAQIGNVLFQASNADVFVAGWDGTGNFLYAISGGGFFVDQGIGIQTSRNGAVWVTGLVVSGGTFGTIHPQPYGGADALFARVANLAVEPTQNSSSLFASGITCSSANLSWQAGNGASRLVIVRRSQAVNVIPLDGSEYTANPVFGLGTDLGGGNYAVYNGTGSSFTLSGLEADSTYFFSIFEYNGSSGSTNYRTLFPFSSSISALGLTQAVITPAGNQTVCSGDSLQLSAVNLALSQQWYRNGLAIPGATNGSYFAKQAGDYTLKVTDAPGCSDSTSTPVQVSQLQSPSVSLSFTQNANTLSFTGSSATATSWFWDFGDNTTSTQQNPTHTYAAVGNYTVCLTATDNQPCSSTECSSVSISVGVDPGEEGLLLLARPNPATESCILNFPSQKGSLEIFSPKGDLLKSLTLRPGMTDLELDLREMPKGLLILHLRGERQSGYLKLTHL